MGRGKPENPPVIYCACPMPIKGLGFFVVDEKEETPETPSYLLCLPHAHKGARILPFVVDAPPPHGAVVHAVRPLPARNCVYLPLFRRRSNGLL